MADAHAIAVEVLAESERQDEKWGEQNHPDGTGSDTRPLADVPYRAAMWGAGKLSTATAHVLAAAFTQNTDTAAANGHATWSDILLEEVFEAIAEGDADKLRVELIQVSAVAQQWVQAIDRRGAAS